MDLSTHQFIDAKDAHIRETLLILCSTNPIVMKRALDILSRIQQRGHQDAIPAKATLSTGEQSSGAGSSTESKKRQNDDDDITRVAHQQAAKKIKLEPGTGSECSYPSLESLTTTVDAAAWYPQEDSKSKITDLRQQIASLRGDVSRLRAQDDDELSSRKMILVTQALLEIREQELAKMLGKSKTAAEGADS